MKETKMTGREEMISAMFSMRQAMEETARLMAEIIKSMQLIEDRISTLEHHATTQNKTNDQNNQRSKES